MITAKQKQKFLNEGYLIVRSVVPTDLIEQLWSSLVKILEVYGIDAANYTGFDDLELSREMMKLRTNEKNKFGLMYDSMQTSVSLWSLGTHFKLSSIASDLMSCERSELTLTDLLMRMDAPLDKRNKLKWHQDSSYFTQNKKGKNGCVCSMAICDLSIQNRGQLEIVPKSHELGRISVTNSAMDLENTSKQLHISEDLFSSYNSITTDLNFGDALYLNFDMIHRSGTNLSELFRFTAISRYHKMTAKDFSPGWMIYKKSIK